MKDIERLIVDYFDICDGDVENIDGEWLVYINDGDGKVSLTGLALAIALSLADRQTGDQRS